MKESLIVVGTGAYTAVGSSAAQTCAAIRAGISGFARWDLSHLDDQTEAIVAAPIPMLPTPRDNRLFDRLVMMAVPAIEDCLAASGIEAGKLLLLLGIRDGFRSHPQLDGREADLIRAIEDALGLRFHRGSAVVPEGRPAALLSLANLHTLLDRSQAQGAVVGGVDSLINWYDFQRFDATCRIKREGVEGGFTPGEGAAFVVVDRRPAERHATTRHFEILGVGVGQESAETTMLSEGHPTGRGLHQALVASLRESRLEEAQIDFRVSDINGEHYRGVEALLGVNRFYQTRREHLHGWFPAACVGDIGAGFGALLIIVAMAGIVRGYGHGPVAMCESGSDTGLNAACLLAMQRAPGGVAQSLGHRE